MKFKSYERLENEADRTIELRGVPENGGEPSIHIAYFAMGSGLALDEGGIMQADDSDADGFDAAVSGAIDVAQKKGYAIPADICKDLVRLAHLTLPTTKVGGFLDHRPTASTEEVLHGLPKRIGSGVPHPTM